MGLGFPNYPGDVSDGDERAVSPKKTTDSILATERGTDYTRRIETDDERNLYVHVAKDSSGSGLDVGVLSTGTASGISYQTLTTITTYVASATTRISKISVSGDAPADYTVVLNTTTIDVKRTDTSDLDRDFSFEHPLTINLNDVLEVKVFHQAPSKSRTFDATIYGA